MAVSRTSLVTGPAKVTFNSATLFSKDDFAVSIEKDTLLINTAAHGKVDERAIETKAEVSFTPEGRWTDALIAAIFTPFASMSVGTSIATATDKPVVMSAADGEIHTIIAGCITKLPDIFLSATKTLLGPITITGIRKLAGDWTTANSLYTIAATGGSVADATFDPLDIPVQPYIGVWGAVAGFTSIDTEDGWTISFDLQTEPKTTDAGGIIDIRFKSLSVMAKCTPIGPTSTQVLNAMQVQGGRARGYSLQEVSAGVANADLVITGADGVDYVTLTAASLKTAGFRFGATTLRNNEIGFVATRTFATGVANPLFALDAAA